jgi:ABC-2 type transport system ATP-binding protein
MERGLNTSSKEYIIVTENLTKRYDSNIAVNNINLKVKRGEIFGLVGPDGAGKTTTIQMLSAILDPTEGNILIDGYNIKKEADNIRKIVGYMSQDFTLYEDLTVEENLDFAADLRHIPQKDREDRKERLLNFSKLSPFKDRLSSKLSGGMKKKLALSCALIHLPKILILDEPTTAVDPISRVELWRILYESLLEGVTIFISTPYLDEAERCNRVGLIEDGNILSIDTPTNLKKLIDKRVYSLNIFPISKGVKVLRDDFKKRIQIFGDRVHIFEDKENELNEIKEKFEDKEIKIIDIEITEPNLEDIFIKLIGSDGDISRKSWISFSDNNTLDTTIEVKDIHKNFGKFKAVDGVSFSIGKGKIFGLLGPNGAGKTTLIRILCGLLAPTSGKAAVLGYDVSSNRRNIKSKIGYMSQKFSLYPDLTVKENLDLYEGIYGVGKNEKEDIRGWIIEIAGLKGKENILTRELPGGFKQRLALGCALIHKPSILFLDEPTSGIDPISRMDFWDIIYRLAEDGVTVLVTTHFMDEAERCHILGLMHDGKLIALGSPDDLKEEIKEDFYEISSPTPLKTFESLYNQQIFSHLSLFGEKIHGLLNKRIENLERMGIERIKKIKPSLQDVFIYNIYRAQA